MSDEEDSLETLLVKTTNPLNKEPDHGAIHDLCERITKEERAHQKVLTFLAHKIQSPQEKEAFLSLTVLDECVDKCGTAFHSEVGKFRFLNEIIKVISPKYFGTRSSPKVKERIIEIMYKWTVYLKQEPKICEAYEMLKNQGYVPEDPVHILKTNNFLPSARPKHEIYDDEEKSRLLQKLLQSNSPSDIEAANSLIRDMVKEASRKEQIRKQKTLLEGSHENISVLKDLLAVYESGRMSLEEKNEMKDLFNNSKELHLKLIRLASEIDEQDESLGQILDAICELSTVISQFKDIILDTPEANGVSLDKESEPILMDLNSPQENLPSRPSMRSIDESLLSLGFNDLNFGTGDTSQGIGDFNSCGAGDCDLSRVFSTSAPAGSSFLSQPPKPENPPLVFHSMVSITTPSVHPHSNFGKEALPSTFSAQSRLPPITQGLQNNTSRCVKEESHQCTPDEQSHNCVTSKAMDELNSLGEMLLKETLSATGTKKTEFPSTPQKISLNQLQKPQASSLMALPVQQTTVQQTSPASVKNDSLAVNYTGGSPSVSPSHGNLNLSDVFVPLENVHPGLLPALTLHEKNGLKTVIHFGKDRPRPDVSVMVASITNNSPKPIQNVSFMAAVPKAMKIKLQPPSATELPHFIPFQSQPAITQVMLVANPNNDKVHLKYRISYTIDGELCTDMGEVDDLFKMR